MLKIRELEDSIQLEGYINVTERPSKLLSDKDGQFIEVMKQGTFERAITPDVKLLNNHDFNRDLGTDFTLEEDSVGLKFRATITDSKLIQDAKAGLINGCSFGFQCLNEVRKNIEGVATRFVDNIKLYEVSILSGTSQPAYSGCVVETRADDAASQQGAINKLIYEIRTVDTSTQGADAPWCGGRYRNLSYEAKEEIIEDVKSDEEDQEKEILIDETLNDSKASDIDIQEASKDKAENQLEMMEDLKKFIITEKIKNEIKGLRG